MTKNVRYRVTATVFVNGSIVRPGTDDKPVYIEAKPGMDTPGSGLVLADGGVREKDAPPSEVIDISGWRDMHHTQMIKLAKSLPGEFSVPDGKTAKQVATELLEAEEDRQAAL